MYTEEGYYCFTCYNILLKYQAIYLGKYWNQRLANSINYECNKNTTIFSILFIIYSII